MAQKIKINLYLHAPRIRISGRTAPLILDLSTGVFHACAASCPGQAPSINTEQEGGRAQEVG